GHANSTVINRISITVRRIKKIKDLFGEIKPTVSVEIPCMDFSNRHLEIPLPLCDYFMIRLCGGSKIVRCICPLFMKVYMYLWHPFIILKHSLLALRLCLPGPVAIEIKIIMIGSATRPGLPVFAGIRS